MNTSTYAKGKGVVINQRQNEMAWKNSICICKFPGQTPLHLANALAAVTGWDIEEKEMEAIGERIYNLTRCFNVREGFTRKDDTLPPRYFEEPLPDGPSKGLKVGRSEFERMLDEYYEVRGWSREGVPTEDTLRALDLWQLVESPMWKAK